VSAAGSPATIRTAIKPLMLRAPTEDRMLLVVSRYSTLFRKQYNLAVGVATALEPKPRPM